VRFGRKDPADTLGGEVQGGEGGECVAAADLAARLAGDPADEDEPTATDHSVTTLVAFVLDISGSVVKHDNEVVTSFGGLVGGLQDDHMTALGVRLGLVDTWEKVTGFAVAKDFEPPDFLFGSSSPLGRATSRACELLRTELKAAAAHGRPVNKVLLVEITDSQPHGESPADTREGIRQVTAMRKGHPPINVFGFFVGPGQPGEFLRALCGDNPVIHAAEPEEGYRRIFEWLLSAIQSCAQSQPGQKIQLPNLSRGLVAK
jgi:uncharacterized protein YegL